MKMKLFVIVITLSLLLSGMLVAVGGEAKDGERSIGKGIEETKTQSAQQIYDWHDLNNMRDNLNGDYVLMNDLDENTSGYMDYNDPNTAGWEPIGEDPEMGDPFGGSFDGHEHTITGLYIDRPDENEVGLFGETGNVVIKNVGLEDVDITGYDRVGGLVGFHDGEIGDEVEIKISNSYVKGNVSGHNRVGGLIGNLYWAEISNSHANVSVSGWNIGGLVASMHSGKVSQSYATGSVEAEYTAGGLSGSVPAGCSVYRSYSTASVTGGADVGGLVGNNYGNVSNSYSTGEVNSDDTAGGLIGTTAYDGTVYNSFWDVETSRMDTSDGGTGKTTAEMKDVATYTDTATEGLDESWDFVGDPNDDTGDEEIWDIDDDGTINDGYPFLAWEEEEVVEYELTINIGGEGSTNPSEGTHTYDEGKIVTVEATPAEGWEFVEWTGDATGTDSTIDITMDENKSITANFEEVVEYDLTINIEGNGTVEVDGEEVEDGWTGEFQEGTNVSLEAIADENWTFEEWTGDATGNETTINITMDEDKTITANFEEEEEDESEIPGIPEVPGFTTMILLLAVITAVAIYRKKKR